MRRELQSRVEDRFAEEFLNGAIKNGENVVIDAKDNELVFNTVKIKEANVSETSEQ